MAKVALITGVTGQDGSYLAEFLIKQGYEVHGIVRRTSSFATGRIDHMRKGFGPGLRRSNSTTATWATAPDCARSSSRCVPTKFTISPRNRMCGSHSTSPNTPPTWWDLGALRLLEALRDHNKRHGRAARYYQAGSSEMFGRVAEVPQRETTPFHPRSPYACAKVYAHWQTINYREAYGLFAANGILFNHESPRRGENFVTRKSPAAPRASSSACRTSLALGNLDARRDWGFAGDYVEAMWMMLQQEQPDDYVVATGETHSVQEFLERAFDLLKLDWRKHIQTDPRYLRPAEVDLLQGDSSKARRLLGWQPRVNFRAAGRDDGRGRPRVG